MAALSEVNLRALSRQFGAIVPQSEPVDDQEVRRLEDLLRELFDCAEGNQLAIPHRAAACNALCGFIEATSGSSLQQVRSVTLTSIVWSRLLSFYLDRFQDTSARSMKQVLSTLTKLIVLEHEKSVSKKDKWVEDAAKLCLGYITSSADNSCVKPSIILLELLLAKNLLRKNEFIQAFSLFQKDLCYPSRPTNAGTDTCGSEYQELQHFVECVLKWSRNSDLSLVAGRLLRTIFARHDDIREVKRNGEISPDLQEPVWLLPILNMAKEESADLDKLEKHILPELLAADEVNVLYLAQQVPIRQLLHGSTGGIEYSDVRFALLLVKVMGNMKLSYILRTLLQSETQTPVEDLRDKLAICCIQHQSPHIRIAATNSLVLADGSAESFRSDHLQLLRPVLQSFFTETDPKTRGDSYTILKRMISRLTMVINKLKKTTTIAQANVVHDQESLENNQNLLRPHLEFVSWFHGFLCAELRPSASYQRHVMALKTLNMASNAASIMKLFSVCEINFFTPAMIRQLTEMVLDAFDDVRDLSAALLRSIDSPAQDVFNRSKPNNCVISAKNRMITTGRASISDGYARLTELSYHFGCNRSDGESIGYCTPQLILSEIRIELIRARSNLHAAVAKPELHGQLSALKYIVNNPKISASFMSEDEWRKFQDDLFDCCQQAWEIVKPILCIDSPEGQGEGEANDEDIGVKDIPSFSWRTLKEASALMQAALANPTYGFNGLRGLQYEDYRKLGDLAFTQLSDLRHRGAFSSVALCFTTCCIECGQSSNAQTKGLPGQWYEQALLSIDLKASSLTRRSGGLPAIMTSVLASDPISDFFDTAMLRLLDIASQPASSEHEHGKTGLPQVHAMNCIKDIFAHTRLASSAEMHLEASLNLAVRSLNHGIWSIRNCGGMLLKAILNRLSTGSSKDDRQGSEGYRRFAKAVYNRYPSLATAVETLLNASTSADDIDSSRQTEQQVNNGFPALEIIDRVGVKESRRDAVVKLLHYLLASPVWSLRQRAAIALSQLLDGDTLVMEICQSIELGLNIEGFSFNKLHGQLLCMKFSIGHASRERRTSLLQELLSWFDRLVTLPCRFTTITFFEVLSTLFDYSLRLDTNSVDESLIDVVYQFWCERSLSLYRDAFTEIALNRFTVYLISWLRNHSPNSLDVEVELSQLDPDAIGELVASYPDLLQLWERDLERLISSDIDNLSNDSEAPQLFKTLEQFTKLLKNSPLIPLIQHTAERASVECESWIKRWPSSTTVILEFQAAIKLFNIPIHSSEMLWFAWVQAICLSMSKDQEWIERLAALKQLNKFKVAMREQVIRQRNGQPAVMIGNLLGVFYDGLVDDDVEIRDVATEVVSYVFSSTVKEQPPPSLTNLAAQDLLFQHIRDHEQDSVAITVEGFTRLLGLPGSHKTPSTTKAMQKLTLLQWISTPDKLSLYLSLFPSIGPAATGIEAVLNEDTSLFTEERQNLYKDNVQEMERWADIMIALKPPVEEMSRIYDWALYSLEAVARSNGSPGWANLQEGFEAVCRVLIFAQVTLSWNSDPNFAKRLRDAVLGAETQLGLAHQEHTKIINALKTRLQVIDIDGGQ